MQPDNQNFISAFSHIGKRYKGFVASFMQGFSLTPGERDVLVFLANNAPEWDTARDICTLRGISKALASRSISSLISQRLVAATPDPVDQWLAHLSLTPRAVHFVHTLEAANTEFMQRITSGISKKDLGTFQSVMNRLSQNAQCLSNQKQ